MSQREGITIALKKGWKSSGPALKKGWKSGPISIYHYIVSFPRAHNTYTTRASVEHTLPSTKQEITTQTNPFEPQSCPAIGIRYSISQCRLSLQCTIARHCGCHRPTYTHLLLCSALLTALLLCYIYRIECGVIIYIGGYLEWCGCQERYKYSIGQHCTVQSCNTIFG